VPKTGVRSDRGTPYCLPCHKKNAERSWQKKYGNLRNRSLIQRYGIDEAQFDALKKQQGGLCAICQLREAKVVDHCHKTNEFRGLLCHGCNGALGTFFDDPRIFLRAIQYLTGEKVNTKQLLEDLAEVLVEFRRFSHQEARDIGNRIGVDWDEVDIKEFAVGLSVELEHGSQDKQTDITHNDLLKTGKIALAHLKEYPDYYKRLKYRAHIRDVPPIV
jgi:hypothetical protein